MFVIIVLALACPYGQAVRSKCVVVHIEMEMSACLQKNNGRKMKMLFSYEHYSLCMCEICERVKPLAASSALMLTQHFCARDMLFNE